MTDPERRAVAEQVRAACVAAARDGYQDAAIAGLCAEGALEAALSAIERLDLAELLAGCGDEGGR